MVTHDARAAAIADRILFLADGLIVRELGTHERRRDPARDERARPRVTAFALKGLLGRKLRTALTAHRDRARRRDGDGDLHPHRLDQGRLRRRSSRRSTAARTRRSPASPRSTSPTSNNTTAPPFDESLLARCARLPDVADAVGGVGGDAHLIGHERQGDRLRRRAEPRLQRRPDAARRSTRSRSSTARGRRRTSSSSTSRPPEEGPRGRPDDRRPGERAGAAA